MPKHVKKIMPYIIAAIMIVSVFPFAAHADPSTEHVRISVTPSEMSQEGTATVSITLTNTNTGAKSGIVPDSQETDDPEPTEAPTPTEPATTPTPPPAQEGAYTNINISNSYGVSFDTSGVTLAPGASRTFSGSMRVTTAMIGTTLSFTVSWSDGGTQRQETVTTMIVRSNKPYLMASRTASPAKAAPGTVVTVTYTFVNAGTAKLVNITVIDRKISGSSNPMFTPFGLEIGETKSFTYTFTMGSSTVESNPQVTYYAAGSSTQLSASISSMTIGLINSQLSKDVVRGTPTPEGVPFTLYLTNNGNQTLKSLVVKDELGNTIYGGGFSLAVGESKTIQAFIPNPSSVRYVVFKITGQDSEGTPFSDNTASYAVRPYIDTSLLGLRFMAHVVSPLNEENRITIEFTLENTGSLSYYDLTLKEDQLDYTLESWEELASGHSEMKRIELTLDGERELMFELTAEDSSGNPYVFEAYVTAAYVDGSQLVPYATPDPSGGAKPGVDIVPDDSELGAKLDGLITSTGEKLMKWFKVLGIIAAAAAFAMLVLAISEIVIRRNNRAKNSRKP